MSVVLVTGASRGIGRAIVERFAREGCTVIACARGQEALDELQAALPDIDCRSCDMRDDGAVDALALEVLARHGTVDLLVNNAGAYRPGQIATEDDGALLDMLQANLFGAYLLTKRVLPGATLTASWDGVPLPPERLMPAEDVAEMAWSAWTMSARTVVEDIVMRPQLGDIGEADFGSEPA